MLNPGLGPKADPANDGRAEGIRSRQAYDVCKDYDDSMMLAPSSMINRAIGNLTSSMMPTYKTVVS